MNILYVCHGPLPSPHTDTEQLLQTVTHLAGPRIAVDLVFPSSPGERRPISVRRGEIAAYYGFSAGIFEQGLRLLEVPLPFWLTGDGRKGVFSLRAAQFARGRKYDLVYTRDLFPVWACLMAGLRVVYETYRVDINTRRWFLPWRMICYTRRNLLGVIAHSGLALQAFVGAGIDDRRALLAYNGFSPQAMLPALSREKARRATGLPVGRKIVVYTGHVGPNKGLEAVLSIADRLPHLLFLVVGGVPLSPGMRWFQGRVQAVGLANVLTVPRVPPSEVASYLYAADCLIIPPTAAPLIQYGRTVLPIKTFLYMAAGRPIVAPALEDSREVLREGDNALLVPPDAPEAGAAAIRGLLEDPALQERLSRNAQRDAMRYTWDRRAVLIAEFLRRLVG